MGARPAAPLPGGDGGIAGPPPISSDLETVFSDDDDDLRADRSADIPDNAAADSAFGAPTHAQERRPPLARVAGFLRGCWAELQRVQWPDRQQVAQATSVVLGFVLLTGVFLGVADYVAGKLINWIV